MKIILYMLQKEFRQIFRNKAMLPIILVMPIVQLLILSNAATFEIKNLKIYFNDFDKSTYSRRLKSKFFQTDYFLITGESGNREEAEYFLEKNMADIVCEIPPDFEKDAVRYGETKIYFKINAIDGMKAGLSVNYAQNILESFISDANNDLFYKLSARIEHRKSIKVKINYSNWYNEKLDYKTFMVPGLLVLLVTLIGGFLSALNIVREKEMGTIEQINVTPIKKHQFIIGKLLPFWILALFVFTVGLLCTRYIFNIPLAGSLFVLYTFAAIFVLAIMGIGLFLSSVTDTQQQAMFVFWFIVVIFILMSGLFTPIENMPDWAQNLTRINPLRYFMEVIRMVVLKGSGFQEVQKHFLIITGFAIVMNVIAVWRYRKKS
jgi:ABC-2 type transport system permease protein